MADFSKTINTRIALLAYASEDWAADTKLKQGEIGIVTDVRNAQGGLMFKIGDGTTLWENLPYANEVPAIVNSLDSSSVSSALSAAQGKALKDLVDGKITMAQAEAVFSKLDHTHTAADVTNFASAVKIVKVDDASHADVAASADKATKLETARSFSVSGDVATSSPVSFDGTGNVELEVSLASGVVTIDNVDDVLSGKIADGVTAKAVTDSLYVNGVQVVQDGNKYEAVINGTNALVGTMSSVSTYTAPVATDTVAQAVAKLAKGLDDVGGDALSEVEAGNGIAVSSKANHKQTISAVVKTGDKVLANGADGLSTTLSMSYDADNRLIKLFGIDQETPISSIDASAFVKDGFLKGAASGKSNASGELTVTIKSVEHKFTGLVANNEYLCFCFTDGAKPTETLTWEAINVNNLVDVYTAGNGLELTNKSFSVKLDGESDYLSVSASGVKFDDAANEGMVDSKITAAIGGLDSTKKGEGTFVDVTVVEEDGKIKSVTVDESDIASANDLADEISRASDAEETLTSSIAEEASRAKASEAANATSIASEVTRATGAEATLASRVSDAETLLASKVDKVNGYSLVANTDIAKLSGGKVEASNAAFVTGDQVKTAIDSMPHQDTTYTFAEGNTDGAFSVTPSTSGATAQTVSIHGLKSAAYEDTTAFVSATLTPAEAGAEVNKIDKVAFTDGETTTQATIASKVATLNLSAFAKTAAVETLLASKVNKVDGKGLSTNDYTNDDKERLAAITDEDYKNKVTDVKINTSATESYTSVLDGTVAKINLASYAKSSDVTALLASKVDKNGTDRLMTVAEGTKLAGIASGAEVNVIDGIATASSNILSITNKKLGIDLSSYATKEDITAVFKFKGTKDTKAEILAITDPSVGDVWHCTADSSEYVCTSAPTVAGGTGAWEELGLTVDLTNYATKTYVDSHTWTSSDITDFASAVKVVKVNSATAADAASKVANKLTVKTKAGNVEYDGAAAKSIDISIFAETSDVNTALDGKVDKEDNARLMTDAEATKLSGIASGAQVNVIETIKVNGSAASVVDKAVNIVIPSDAGKANKVTGTINVDNLMAIAADGDIKDSGLATSKVVTDSDYLFLQCTL